MLTERKLFLAPKHPAFDITIPPNGLSLELNLADHFKHDSNSKECQRLVNGKSIEAVEITSAAASSNHNPKPHLKRGSAAVASNPALPSAAPQTRAKAAQDKIALVAWYAELTTAIPALVGIPMPCLYWLSNTAPCSQHTTCQKTSHKKPHVVPPVMQPHKAAMLVWLKKDPLGRF